MTLKELLKLGIITDSITVIDNGCIRYTDIVDIKDYNWRGHVVGKVFRKHNGKLLTLEQVEEKIDENTLNKKVLGCFGLGIGMMGIILED